MKSFKGDLKRELSQYDSVNEKAEADCQVQFVPRSKLAKIDRPFGNGVLGYKVNGVEHHPYCKWMAIQEPKFIDIMRAQQNKRALKMMSTKNKQ